MRVQCEAALGSVCAFRYATAQAGMGLRKQCDICRPIPERISFSKIS